MFATLLQQRRVIRIVGLLFLLVAFWQRITVGLSLFATFLLFPLLPPTVLGDGDGWNLTAPSDAPEVVPRIIHQVRLGDLQMRDSWREANESCASLHASPHWRFEVWDTPRANAFVEQHFPELLDTYLGYEQEIQRSNVIRYLVLYKMGGMDLDLDPNNAFMEAAPGHPFLKHAINNLKRYDLNWISLYVTDMFSTGCQFLSTMHLFYSGHRKLRVLPPEYMLSGYTDTPIFVHLGASSWHRRDALTIKAVVAVVQWFFDEPWRLIAVVFGIVSFCLGVYHLRTKGVEKAQREDVEMFGVQSVLLLQEEGRQLLSEEDRRDLEARLWPDSFASQVSVLSPVSSTGTSDSTLRGDEEESDVHKVRYFNK